MLMIYEQVESESPIDGVSAQEKSSDVNPAPKWQKDRKPGLRPGFLLCLRSVVILFGSELFVKRQLSILILVWTLAAPVSAGSSRVLTQSAQRQAPVSASGLFHTTPLTSKVLANGLEVIVVEDHSIPLVTVELAVKNGSYTEPPELTRAVNRCDSRQ